MPSDFGFKPPVPPPIPAPPVEFKAPPIPAAETVNMPMTVEGNTYLHELCLRNAPLPLIREAVQSLGARTDVLNKRNISPLGLAIINNNMEMIQCLLDLGAKIYFFDGTGRPIHALAIAISFGRDDVVKLLLKNGGGLYVNQPGTYPVEKEAVPCLSHAVRENKASLIETLVFAGAFLNEACGKDGLPPLHRAVLQNSPEAVEKLVMLGAEIDQPQSTSGMTPLHYAASALGKLPVVTKLLEMGADPDAPMSGGVTPLMLAASQGNATVITLLLKAGADVNRKCTSGKRDTALHRAAANGSLETIAVLLEGGADPLLTDSDNLTVARSARAASRWQAANKLEEAEKAAEQKFFDNAYDKLQRRNRRGKGGPS